jgi:peptidyl-prolyl cis-trans isomerase SurA
MDDLEVQMKAGAPFATVARQFSQNPTAAAGGDLGVVVEGQLPKELNDALVKMRPGVVTDPIKSVSAITFSIFAVARKAPTRKFRTPARK